MGRDEHHPGWHDCFEETAPRPSPCYAQASLTASTEEATSNVTQEAVEEGSTLVERDLRAHSQADILGMKEVLGQRPGGATAWLPP